MLRNASTEAIPEACIRKRKEHVIRRKFFLLPAAQCAVAISRISDAGSIVMGGDARDRIVTTAFVRLILSPEDVNIRTSRIDEVVAFWRARLVCFENQ